jgi:hypothetical protein
MTDPVVACNELAKPLLGLERRRGAAAEDDLTLDLVGEVSRRREHLYGDEVNQVLVIVRGRDFFDNSS